MTAQGHPRAIFQRAIERGNPVAAEASAREIKRLTLEEALRLLFLYAEKEPIKYERAALRWLARYVSDGKAVSLLKAQLALSALAEMQSRRARSGDEAARRTTRRPVGLLDRARWCGLDQTIGCYALLDDEVPARNVGQDVGAGAVAATDQALPRFTKTTILSPAGPLSMTFAMKYPGVGRGLRR